MDIGFVLITGFLGAGKTTFLNHLLATNAGTKTGVIVNEFGRIGIDGRLIHSDDNMKLYEINNGSIFCCCRASELVETLVSISATDVDRVIVEATGLADPSNLFELLSQANAVAERPFRYQSTVCLIDGVHFMNLVKALPVLERQICFSDSIIINKCDLIGSEQLAAIREMIAAIAPIAAVYETSYGKVDLPEDIDHTPKAMAESLNTLYNRPRTEIMNLKKNMTKAQMDEVVKGIRKKVYRAKGFATIDGTTHYIDIVGDLYCATPVKLPGARNKIILLSLKYNSI